jgi:hypothetical protein
MFARKKTREDIDPQELAAEYREPNLLPPARRRNWLIVFGFIGVLGITGLILIALYRQVPKKSAPVAKRTTPATRTVFTSILSPVDSATARFIVEEASREIGADSANTQMTVSGTAVYKRCTSLRDFQNLLFQALTSAEPENLKRQSLLLSHVAGVITSDVLPTTLFVVGRVAEEEFEPQEKRLIGFSQALGARHESLGRVAIVAFIPPASADSTPNLSTRARFLQTLKRGKYELSERPLAPLRQENASMQ